MLAQPSIIDHAALEKSGLNIYALPRIYDRVLEVFYPDQFYKLETVYQVAPTNVKIIRGSATSNGSTQGAMASTGKKVFLAFFHWNSSTARVNVCL